MPVTAASMRTSYPALFKSTTIFPDAYLTARITEAQLRTTESAWPSTAWYDTAILYKAAELALRGIRNFQVSAPGGSGAVQSMSTLVGSVSYALESNSPKYFADSFKSEYDNLARLTSPVIAISGS